MCKHAQQLAASRRSATEPIAPSTDDICHRTNVQRSTISHTYAAHGILPAHSSPTTACAADARSNGASPAPSACVHTESAKLRLQSRSVLVFSPAYLSRREPSSARCHTAAQALSGASKPRPSQAHQGCSRSDRGERGTEGPPSSLVWRHAAADAYSNDAYSSTNHRATFSIPEPGL